MRRLIDSVSEILLGKHHEIELVVAAFCTGGHVLIEDIPGVGKTTLARSLAILSGLEYKRIQCTPDLMPSDITGSSIFRYDASEFEFKKGPVFTNVLMADEINRATPKTQSALLEAMQEQQVTADGVIYKLETPFFLIATQNPLEFEGTYPLPEAQLDRFMIRLSLGYPSKEHEIKMLQMGEFRTNAVEAIDWKSEYEKVQKVHVESSIIEYLYSIVDATRNHPDLSTGVSPRATKALFDYAKAYAHVNGRDYVTPEDVAKLVPYVFGHRIVLRHEARYRGFTSNDILKSIVTQIKIPKVMVK